MVVKALQCIRRGLHGISDLLAALARTPKHRSRPDPTRSAAKRVRGAMSIGSKGASGTSATDKFLGKELADGHRKSR